ncbi:hypothetical protein TrST_g12293 [Triparma strigata]|uniref:Uncharacterized protein n=1 Tax=Triparma strigata TaxID=1606541 RepID=A0A9W7BCB8_9STRA|nr:hypothetical protein TrST_g12293 [Triparma strigata]
MCPAHTHTTKVHPDDPQPRTSRQESFRQLFNFSNLALYAGAGLSIFDLIFDVAMVYEYFKNEKPQFARATLISIGLNLALQVAVTLIQNKKRKRRVKIREVFFVLTFVKPGIDAWRVVTKRKHHALNLFSPMMEYLLGKGIELVFECIPSTIIQVLAFVEGQHSAVVILSLCSSILTAAFISASMSIEKDIDKNSRRFSPYFYGFVNLESKVQSAVVCMLVLVLSACQLSSKAFAMALGASESATVLAAYLLVDMGFALMFKLARGDFLYWMRIEEISMRFLVSSAMRLCNKILIDFTGMIQMRHPFEYGGLYFSTVLLTTPLVSLYFGSRYLAYTEDEEVKATLKYVFSSNQIYGGLGCLAAVQLFSFSLFLVIIPPKFRTTFLSAQTGSQYACANFFRTTTDHGRVDIFTLHPSLSLPIKQEVKAWLNESLAAWIAEKPSWFNDQVKTSIFDDYVDQPEMLKQIRGEAGLEVEEA